MKIVQMTVTKTFLDRKGLPMSIGVTADLRESDDIGRCLLLIKDLLEVKTAFLPTTHADSDRVLPRRPSKDQWFRLRQQLIRKKCIDTDSDVFEYVAGKLGTEDIEMVSAEEVEKLIRELEEN